MEKLEIKPTYKFPKVIFDPFTNYYEISGHSIPENAVECYKPLFNWLEANINEIQAPVLEFNFKIDYMNSSSTRMLILLINRLEQLANNQKQILIKWYYEDNEDDLDTGKLYQACTKLPFRLIPILKN